MNEVDIIRNIINLLGQQSPNQAKLTPVEIEHPDETDNTTMVFPLQQKMNFLKQLINPCDSELAQVNTSNEIDPITLIIQNNEDNLF